MVEAVKRRSFLQAASALGVATAVPTVLRYAHAAAPGVADDAITLANTMPLSGPLGALGKHLVQGMDAALQKANANGGVHGRTILLQTLDDGSDTVQAERNIKRYLSEGNVFAFMSCGATSINQRIIPLIERDSVPYLAPFTGSNSIRLADYKHVFHVRASYRHEVQALMEHAANMHTQSIAVVYANNRFGRSLRDDAIQALEKNKVPLATAIAVDVAGRNTTVAVDKIQTSKGSLVFLACAGKLAMRVTQALKSKVPTLPILATSVGFPPNAYLVLKDAMVGMGISRVMPDPNRQRKAIVREYQSVMQEVGGTASSAGIEGYINMRVMLEALERAGPDLSRAKLLEALAAIKKWDLGGFVVNFPDVPVYEGSHFVELGVVSKSGVLLG